MEIYSHRGIGLGPENSLASIKEAKKLGIGYECDMRKTQDNVLVLFHDDTLDRITGTSGSVESKPYEELEPFGIPRLEDALTVKVKFDLEIKGDAGNETLAMVERHGVLEEVIFTSFDLQTVKEIKKKNNKATVGYITEEKLPPDVLPTLADAGMDYICPHADTLTKPFVQAAHQAGLKILPWCPSTDTSLQNAISYNVDGLILNSQ